MIAKYGSEVYINSKIAAETKRRSRFRKSMTACPVQRARHKTPLPKVGKMILRRIRKRDRPVVPRGFNLSVNARGRSGQDRFRGGQSVGRVLEGTSRKGKDLFS